MYQTLNKSHKKNTYFRKYSRVYRNKMASVWTGILLELSVGQNDFPEKNPAKILMASLFYIVSAMTTILCRRDCLKDPPKRKKIIGPVLVIISYLTIGEVKFCLCVIQQLHTSSLLPISFDIVKSFITNSVFQ